MEFLDRVLTCGDCAKEFIFTAGEQLFFFDKQFKNDPKRCKPCKGKRQVTTAIPAKPGANVFAGAGFRTETRTSCSTCGIDTTVPFRPTQGRPVLCRECFQKRQLPLSTASPAVLQRSQATAQMNRATAELIAAGSGREQRAPAPSEMAATGTSN